MFNSTTYADFRVANKHTSIPSYAIQVIQQKENVTKLNCMKCYKENKPVKKSLIFSFFNINTLNITFFLTF